MNTEKLIQATIVRVDMILCSISPLAIILSVIALVVVFVAFGNRDRFS